MQSAEVTLKDSAVQQQAEFKSYQGQIQNNKKRIERVKLKPELPQSKPYFKINVPMGKSYSLLDIIHDYIIIRCQIRQPEIEHLHTSWEIKDTSLFTHPGTPTDL